MNQITQFILEGEGSDFKSKKKKLALTVLD